MNVIDEWTCGGTCKVKTTFATGTKEKCINTTTLIVIQDKKFLIETPERGEFLMFLKYKVGFKEWTPYNTRIKSFFMLFLSFLSKDLPQNQFFTVQS